MARAMRLSAWALRSNGLLPLTASRGPATTGAGTLSPRHIPGRFSVALRATVTGATQKIVNERANLAVQKAPRLTHARHYSDIGAPLQRHGKP